MPRPRAYAQNVLEHILIDVHRLPQRLEHGFPNAVDRVFKLVLVLDAACHTLRKLINRGSEVTHGCSTADRATSGIRSAKFVEIHSSARVLMNSTMAERDDIPATTEFTLSCSRSRASK